MWKDRGNIEGCGFPRLVELGSVLGQQKLLDACFDGVWATSKEFGRFSSTATKLYSQNGPRNITWTMS